MTHTKKTHMKISDSVCKDLNTAKYCHSFNQDVVYVKVLKAQQQKNYLFNYKGQREDGPLSEEILLLLFIVKKN